MIQKRDCAAIREDNLRHDLDCNNTTAAGRRRRVSKNNYKEIYFMQLNKKLKEKNAFIQTAIAKLTNHPLPMTSSLDPKFVSNLSIKNSTCIKKRNNDLMSKYAIPVAYYLELFL